MEQNLLYRTAPLFVFQSGWINLEMIPFFVEEYYFELAFFFLRNIWDN